MPNEKQNGRSATFSPKLYLSIYIMYVVHHLAILMLTTFPRTIQMLL